MLGRQDNDVSSAVASDAEAQAGDPDTAPLAAPRSVRLVGFAVSAVALVAVVWWIAGQEPPSLPRTPEEIFALVAAVAAYGAGTALRGERWLRLLRASDGRASRADAYGLTAVGYMGNNVLPARGGDLMRLYLMAGRARMPKRAVLGTLIAERLVDVVVLFLVFVLLAYGVLSGVEAPSASVIVAVTIGAVAAVALGIGAIVFIQRQRLLARFRDWARPISTATRALRGRHGALVLGLTVLIWAFEALTYVGVGYAAGWPVDPIEALYLVALTGLFVVVPAGPSNAGTLDAGVLLGVKALGASGSEAISYLLILRFVLLMPITAAGLALLLTRYGGWKRSSEEETEVNRA